MLDGGTGHFVFAECGRPAWWRSSGVRLRTPCDCEKGQDAARHRARHLRPSTDPTRHPPRHLADRVPLRALRGRPRPPWPSTSTSATLATAATGLRWEYDVELGAFNRITEIINPRIVRFGLRRRFQVRRMDTEVRGCVPVLPARRAHARAPWPSDHRRPELPAPGERRGGRRAATLTSTELSVLVRGGFFGGALDPRATKVCIMIE